MPFIVCPTWKNLVPVLLMLHVSMSMAQSTITYTETFDDFLNPDRGFYTPTECKSSNNPTALTVAQLLSYRNTPYTPWQGNYTVATSVVLRQYILDNFRNAPISSAYLNIISADFAAARQAGVRLVLRFAYTDVAPMCGSSICPPYNDASKARILGHIAQIKPILQANSDVILAVQQGFIGIWGEQYYTDHFGDASVQGNLTDQNWIDRLEVLDAVLNAVPSNRMVHVRYPQIKQKAVYGITAPVTSAAMTAAQAFQNTKIARIGFHNDCFLSASDDKGTYWDYGRSGVPASNQTAILKAYADAHCFGHQSSQAELDR